MDHIESLEVSSRCFGYSADTMRVDEGMEFDPVREDLGPAQRAGAPIECPREIELKLELDPGGTDALLDHPLLRNALGGPRQNDSVYYDTKKGALRSAGISLRIRRTVNGFVQTVKSGAKASAGLFNRLEWEETISGPELELDRLQGMDPVLDTDAVRKALKPVYETRIERRACTLEHGGARIELVVDQGEIVAGKSTQPISEVELELIDGPPGALFELARKLYAQVPLRLGVMAKSERGERLASGKARRASKAEPVRLSTEMSVVDGFQTIALSCLRHFRANEPLVIAARDTDALHQSRVALRRLRSALSLFKPVLKGPTFERFRMELRELAAALGAARNLDVLLASCADRLTKESHRRLIEERSRAYDNAIATLKTPQVRATMIDLSQWITLGPQDLNDDTARRAAKPLPPFSRRVLNRYWRIVKREGRRVRRLTDEERHELRIAGKKLRYAAEFFSALQGGEQASGRDSFLSAIEDLQDGLGGLNDLATQRALTAELAERNIVLPSRLSEGSEPRGAVLLDASEKAHASLVEVGPYWRAS